MNNHFKLLLLLMAVYLSGTVMAIRAILADELPPTILINEVLADSTLSASDEFVELINAGSTAIDLEGWKIEYLSASGTNWTAKAVLSGKLMPKDYLLVATDFLEQSRDFKLSSGLARSGGHVRLIGLIDQQQVEIDRMGWGSAQSASGSPISAGQTGQSLKRLVSEDGLPINTNINGQDFFISATPTPQGSLLKNICIVAEVELEDEQEATAPPEENSSNNQNNTQTPTPPPPSNTSPSSYTVLYITELLIDPGPPATDKDDEYVEIHNPHNFAVNIEGYKIQTGLEFRYSFTLPHFILEPKQYLAIYSIDSKLTLANTTGRARLLDPAGNVIDTTDAYEKAKVNLAWALASDDLWLWTKTPTPHGPNVFDEEDLKTATAGLSSGNKLSTSLTNSANRTTNLGTNSYQEPPTENNPISKSVLVWVGAFAILYGVYEYRSEVVSALQKLKSIVGSWRKNRSAT